MKSPADQKIIQIDITNACFNRCSNCTRFVGHKNPDYMDYNTFQKAVESLYYYPGMVGIMGGEPTLHPQFDKLIRYYGYVIPRYTPRGNIFEPISDFHSYSDKNWTQIKDRHCGLWTSMGPGYRRHFELIRDAFEYQCINTHKNKGQHQALMITRKELGIGDEEFFRLRDSCWIQNLWSASITSKGAFFCEIAAALDLLLDGPGGWNIERDWWKRKPEDFGDQLNWCELCSGCLMVPYTIASDEVDTVSPEWKKRLEALGSKKETFIFDVSGYDRSKYSSNQDIHPYLLNGDSSTRISEEDISQLSLFEINVVIVCLGYSRLLETTLKYNKDRVSTITIVTEKEDLDTIRIGEENGAYIVLSEKKKLNGALFNKGAMINDGIKAVFGRSNDPWVLVSDADIIFSKSLKNITRLILNPGALYYADRVNVRTDELSLYTNDQDKLDQIKVTFWADSDAWGYFQLFNKYASVLKNKKIGEWYSEEFYGAGSVDKEFMDNWVEKKFLLTRCLHIQHSEYLGENWLGTKDVTRPIDFLKCFSERKFNW